MASGVPCYNRQWDRYVTYGFSTRPSDSCIATSIKDGKSLNELSIGEKAPAAEKAPTTDKAPAASAEQPQAANSDSEDHASDLEDADMEDVPIGNAGGNPPPPVGNGGNPRDDPSDSDSDSDGDARYRDRRKDLSHGAKGQVVVTTVERPKIPSPQRYAGKQGKLAYRDWKLTLERWFRYHDAAYADEDQKILYVGQLVTSDALTWYNTRVRRLEDMHLTDNWRVFISAMDADFLDDHKADDLFEEMKGLKYEGSIDSYLNTMQAKNHDVGLHGTAYRSLLLSGLNSDLRERMSYSDLPEDDENAVIAKIAATC
jgi:hypothetical protein